ncbi:MAG: DUF445 family protein, partial [Chthoniobacterales bacterium]
IYDSILKSAESLILSHKEVIQEKIEEEVPIPFEIVKGIPGVNLFAAPLEMIRKYLAEAVAEKMIEKVQGVLEEASENPNHSLRKSFDQQVQKFIKSLKSSPEMAQKIGEMQETLAQSTFVDDFSVKTWTELKQFFLRDCRSEDSLVLKKLRAAILTLSSQLHENESTRSSINTFLGEQVLKTILPARPHARELILSTIEKWGTSEMADRLEITVGSDLQFIRLNGTLVGGAMGLTIHAIFTLLGH